MRLPAPCPRVLGIVIHAGLLLLGQASFSAAQCVYQLDTESCRTIGPGAVIFEATIARTERKALPPVQLGDGPPIPAYEELTHLRDIRAIRGTPQDVLVALIITEECSSRFPEGQRYLVVARKLEDGRLAATYTTRPVEDTAEARAKTIQEFSSGQLLGNVGMPRQWTDWLVDYESVPDAVVTARGAAVTRTTTTDFAGRYKFTNLPWGNYTVQVDLPKWTSFLQPLEPQQIALPPEIACAEVEFAAENRSLLEGTVIDARGQPAAGIPIVVHPADYEDARGPANGPGFGVLTDANGRYRFANLPPARYVVGVNTNGEPSPGYPFAEAYAVAGGETLVRVGLGVQATMEPLRLTRVNPGAVTGVVLDADRNPVGGVDVSLWWTTERGYSRREFPVKSDGSGRFRIPAWEGIEYILEVGPHEAPSAKIEKPRLNETITITSSNR